MLTRLLSRNIIPRAAVPSRRLNTSVGLLSSHESSSDSSDSDNEKASEPKPVESNVKDKLASNKETVDKLNALLSKMLEGTPPSTKSVDVAMKRRPKRVESQEEIDKRKTFDERLSDAAKGVASSLGGDSKKIQTELMNKYASRNNEMSITTRLTLMKKGEGSMDLNEWQTSKAARIQRFMRGSQKYEPPERYSRKPQKYRGFTRDSDSLYGGERLDIFTATSSTAPTDVPKLKTWEQMERKELKLSFTYPPRNVFEEMMMWTDQGKLWKFPIDNEQGMEEEQKVHFTEHVFMEPHLKGWCPKKGPLRHFMELVCVGLSKNPYMTVEEKREHIMWYRDYFADKQDLLKDIGLIQDPITPSKPKEIGEK